MKTEINLTKLAFGSDDVQRDAKYGFLDKVFLKTTFYNRVLEGKRDVVTGRKGTGKSAICLMLKSAFESTGIKTVLVTPDSLSSDKISLAVRRSPNRHNSKRVKPCPPDEQEPIRDALEHFGMLQ